VQWHRDVSCTGEYQAVRRLSHLYLRKSIYQRMSEVNLLTHLPALKIFNAEELVILWPRRATKKARACGVRPISS